MDEKVDILEPPLFLPSGKIKTRKQAYEDRDWIGTFNLWVVSSKPVPSIIYQLRSPNKSWAPNKLDVTAGGHLQAGEKLFDGLREVEEELGKNYDVKKIVNLGKKLYVGFNTDGSSHNNIIDVNLTEDTNSLNSYVLQKEEVYAICSCPVSELLKVHRDHEYSFTVEAVTFDKRKVTLSVNSQSFPENYDNYHYKIAILADRYFKGEKDLVY